MLDIAPYCRKFLFSGRQIPRRFPSETTSLVKISISLLQANNPVAGGALDSGCQLLKTVLYRPSC
jgi:hypothetical protein